MAKQKLDKNVVVQQLIIKTANRNTQDIESWRSAIKQFESSSNPVRTKLYDLYEDILLDGQIEATWGKRQDAILNKELLFIKDGKEDEELNKLLNSPNMRDLVRELHNAIVWGYSLVQINNIVWDEELEQYLIQFDLIPRKHVHPERDYQCISFDQNQVTKDILFMEPPLSKLMLWAGEPNGMGLLAKAAQYVIYKRGNFGDWAQFAELFGMPFREGRYDDYDDNTRHALEAAMDAYSGASYAILPKNAEFKIHDNNGTSGSSTLYKDLKDACNAEISKIILGNTLTTEQGENGARSLGEVHMDAEKNKFKADEKFILGILNSKFRSILKYYGFNVQGGHIWFKAPDADWAMLEKKWNVISGIAQNTPVADDFIYEEFDIPKPDNYDELKSELRLGLNNAESAVKTPLNPKKAQNLWNGILDFFV